MTAGKIVSSVVVCWLAASASAFADVQVTMQNGRVSVIAKDATLRQILTEWARVGQTKVVNVERIPGAPMTIELRDMPEAQALAILLRTLSGYMAAPRPTPVANLSQFDRIVVMPTLAAPRQAAAAGAPSTAAPAFQPPPVPPMQSSDAEEERQEAPGRPVFNAFPQPQLVNPNAAPANAGQPGFTPPPGMQMPGDAQKPAPGAFPTAAPGVAVPGMIVPVPQQPGAPAQQVPIRRPGGTPGQ